MSSFTVSSSFSMFSVAVTEKPRIGMLAVLNLNITGSSASSGRRRLARSSRSRMSFAASPSSVPHLNLHVTRETPSLVVDVISSRSVTDPSALSITRVICCSTSSVEAPSQRVKTEIDGLSISGIMSTARRCHAMQPRMNTATNAISVATGRRTPVSDSFTGRSSGPPADGGWNGNRPRRAERRKNGGACRTFYHAPRPAARGRYAQRT